MPLKIRPVPGHHPRQVLSNSQLLVLVSKVLYPGTVFKMYKPHCQRQDWYMYVIKLSLGTFIFLYY